MRLKILLVLGVCLGAFAQSPVNPVTQDFYDGSGNLIYICSAEAFQAVSTFTTSISVSTNTATITFTGTSYLWIGARVTLAGSATTALNGTYKVTAVSGSTATITTSGVSDGTYTDAILTTNAPLLNNSVWSIQVFVYNGSSQFVGSYYAGNPSTAIPRGLACSNRANY